MKTDLIPPKVSLHWVSTALDIERMLRKKTARHIVVRITCKLSEVEAYFVGAAPWEAHLDIIVDGILVKGYGANFSHDEGVSGYERALRTCFQNFNDQVLVTAINLWSESRKE